MFNLNFKVMKKFSFSLMVLAAVLILSVKSYGDNSLKDSIKSSIKEMVMHAEGMKDSVKNDYGLSDEIVKKLSSKELIEVIELKESLKHKEDKDDPMIVFIVFVSFIIRVC